MVGPFLDLLPFKGPFPLTGALTGRPPYGDPLQADCRTGRPLTGRLLTGNTFNYRKAVKEGWALTGSPLRGGDGPYGKGRSLTGRAGVPYGSFTEKDDEEAGRGVTGSALQGETVLTGRRGPYRKGRELPS